MMEEATKEGTPGPILVVAAVIRRGDHFLLARRPAGKRHAGRWEFPGGKLRPGESLGAAARRELAEELGVEVGRVGQPRARLRDPGSPFVVCFCPVTVRGEPRALEHDEVRWVTAREARGLALAPTDQRFLESPAVHSPIHRRTTIASREIPMSHTDDSPNPSAPESPRDFIRAMVAEDLEAGRHERAVTRFPPEPNGYAHIGHAKSIVLNFGIAREFDGVCHLRFDDTNPATEDPEYVEAFQRDVRWLGYDWGDKLFFASDYFERLYELAEGLIQDGKAYVDSLSEEDIREYRGTVTEAGRPSPYRDRSVEENLDLFRRMRAGEFEDGAHVLRAKIDLAASNMKMRDPLLYRIRHESHYRQGDDWCLYPMYDWAHPLSDAFEGITHSLCTLEFENNRELYDWVVEACGWHDPDRPHQTEFARLNLNYTVLSKRKLLQLVREGRVEGWDDPRMPTLSGLRRRGYTPSSIRTFCDTIGVAKANSVVDVAQLEHAVRDELNHEAPRVMAVLDPLKVVIENYPEGEAEELNAPSWPHDIPKEGSRPVPFTRELYIERDDFHEDPPKGFHRLAPGREVRLRYAYFIRCEEVVRDAAGEVVELRCSYDPETRGGTAPDGRKVRGTIHWVSAERSLPATVRLYDRLFAVERPDAEGRDFKDHLNPDSLRVCEDARLEASLAAAPPGSRFQFERQGYFYLDPESQVDGEPPVYHRVVALKDPWARREQERERQRQEEARRAREEAEEAARRERAAATPKEPGEDLEGEVLERFRSLRDDHGVGAQEAEILASDEALAAFFLEAVAAGKAGHASSIANWIVHELQRERKETPLAELPFGPPQVAALVALVEEDRITGAAAKEVFAELLGDGGQPAEIVERRGLEKIADAAALESRVAEVLAAHPREVAAYRDGRRQLLGFFIGKVMQATGGAADPQAVRGILGRELEG